jgi:hypothetical protein
LPKKANGGILEAHHSASQHCHIAIVSFISTVIGPTVRRRKATKAPMTKKIYRLKLTEKAKIHS